MRKTKTTTKTSGQNNNSKEESKLKQLKISNWILKGALYGLIFLIPLFYLTITPGFLEINKQLILTLLVCVAIIAWMSKMVLENQIFVKKNFILIPVVIFLIFYALSTLFSHYQELSLWGYFGGESHSLVTLLTFVIFFFLLFNYISNKKEINNLVYVFLISGALVVIYGIFQLLGLYIIPIEIIKNPAFNTVGSVYMFSAYSALLFLSALIFSLKESVLWKKIALLSGAVIFFIIPMVIYSRSIWLTLFIILSFILAYLVINNQKSKKLIGIVLPMLFLTLSIVMFFVNRPIFSLNLPTEIYLNQKTSFDVAFKSFKENSLLGSGPLTYSYVFKKHRPENMSELWSVNFENPASYFLNIMSTMGILGTLSFLFLVISIIYFIFSKLNKNIENEKFSLLFLLASTGWLYLTIFMFLNLMNLTLLFVWWFYLALLLAILNLNQNKTAQSFSAGKNNSKNSLLTVFLSVLLITGLIALIYKNFQKYIGAVKFQKALALNVEEIPELEVITTEDNQEINEEEQKEKIKKNQEVLDKRIQEIINKLGSAVQIDPNQAMYHRNLANTYFILANKRAGEKMQAELTAEDSNYISNNLSQAVGFAERTIEINPNNSNNYINLAQIYEGVIGIMEEAEEKAVENYKKAAELDPKNPSLYHKIGNVYMIMAQMQIVQERSQQQQQQEAQSNPEFSEETKKHLIKAKKNLNKALEIQNDFKDSRILLAQIAEMEGDLEQAVEIEKETRNLLPNDTQTLLRLGLLFYKQENLEEAKANFQRAIQLDNQYANARYFLGLIYNQENNKEQALEQFRKISELNPDNEEVKKIIDNLENDRDALEGLGQNPQGSQQQAPFEEEESESESESEDTEEDEETVEEEETPIEELPSEPEEDEEE
jgi:tetratricopeptide (TPR) repeat protein